MVPGCPPARKRPSKKRCSFHPIPPKIGSPGSSQKVTFIDPPFKRAVQDDRRSETRSPTRVARLGDCSCHMRAPRLIARPLMKPLALGDTGWVSAPAFHGSSAFAVQFAFSQRAAASALSSGRVSWHLQLIRLASASSRASRTRAGTSRHSPSRRAMLLASGSNYCATLLRGLGFVLSPALTAARKRRCAVRLIIALWVACHGEISKIPSSHEATAAVRDTSWPH